MKRSQTEEANGGADSGWAAFEAQKKKRKSRWGTGTETEKNVMSGLPTVVPMGLSKEQEEQYLLQLQIEEITRRLRTGELGIPPDLGDRSPSPEPIYNNEGKRLNTREYRTRKKLEEERHSLILHVQKDNPDYKPPADYRPPMIRVNDRVYIPQDEHPEINFIGLLIGPRGNTLKNLEKDTGAGIVIRGKGSVKDGKVGHKDGKPLPGQDEPLHAYVTATNPENVKKAVDKIKSIIKEGIQVPDAENELRKQQLRELALLNGTLRENDALTKLKQLAEAQTIVTNTIICTICGGAGHISQDCKQKRPSDTLRPFLNMDNQQNQDVAKMDSEYMSLMAELGEELPPQKPTGFNTVPTNISSSRTQLHLPPLKILSLPPPTDWNPSKASVPPPGFGGSPGSSNASNPSSAPNTSMSSAHNFSQAPNFSSNFSSSQNSSTSSSSNFNSSNFSSSNPKFNPHQNFNSSSTPSFKSSQNFGTSKFDSQNFSSSSNFNSSFGKNFNSSVDKNLNSSPGPKSNSSSTSGSKVVPLMQREIVPPLMSVPVMQKDIRPLCPSMNSPMSRMQKEMGHASQSMNNSSMSRMQKESQGMNSSSSAPNLSPWSSYPSRQNSGNDNMGGLAPALSLPPPPPPLMPPPPPPPAFAMPAQTGNFPWQQMSGINAGPPPAPPKMPPCPNPAMGSSGSESGWNQMGSSGSETGWNQMGSSGPETSWTQMGGSDATSWNQGPVPPPYPSDMGWNQGPTPPAYPSWYQNSGAGSGNQMPYMSGQANNSQSDGNFSGTGFPLALLPPPPPPPPPSN